MKIVTKARLDALGQGGEARTVLGLALLKNSTYSKMCKLSEKMAAGEFMSNLAVRAKNILPFGKERDYGLKIKNSFAMNVTYSQDSLNLHGSVDNSLDRSFPVAAVTTSFDGDSGKATYKMTVFEHGGKALSFTSSNSTEMERQFAIFLKECGLFYLPGAELRLQAVIPKERLKSKLKARHKIELADGFVKTVAALDEGKAMPLEIDGKTLVFGKMAEGKIAVYEASKCLNACSQTICGNFGKLAEGGHVEVGQEGHVYLIVGKTGPGGIVENVKAFRSRFPARQAGNGYEIVV